MMKKLTVLLFILVGLLIVGCQGATSETAVPTVAPTAVPVDESPAEEAAPAEPVAEQPTASAAGALPEAVTAQLDAYLQSQVYTEGGDYENATPGLVLLVDTPNGRYLNAAGLANMADGTPMRTDDILQIGSNTKSMTIVILMQLVEEGVLTLQDPLSQWLPEQAAILPNGDQMTIRQLANHTTGAWDYGDPIIGAGLDDPVLLEKGYSPAELVEYAVENGTPDFAPGEAGKWKYSNTGYILLGMILEKATGETYRDLLQTRIFDPLGLDSAVLIEDVPTLQETSTRGYVWNEAGDMIDGANWNGSQGWAAGSAAMTAADLATYGHALANGQFFHNPETLAEMLTFNADALNIVGAAYGLGLMDFANDGTVWGHEGATFAFQSLWYTEPEAEIVVVGLTNSGSYSGFNFLNVLHILEGDGALPVSAGTLLPAGSPTPWQWAQFVSPTEATDIDETTSYRLIISADQTITFNTSDCGVANGAYTVAGMGNIDLEIDGSTLTCEADSLAVQAVEQLNDAETWRFDNGRLLIDLPADGGTFVFKIWDPSITFSSPTDEEVQNWHWVSLTDAEGNQTAVDEGYTYNFSLVGDLLIIGTGCRVTTGSYEIEGQALSLTFDTPEKTDPSCEEGPYADQFYELLQRAEAVVFVENQMIIVSADDTDAPIGTLTFAPLATE
ncbi:MAG: serine hydrolase [Anaerolineales bacterium]|nr:serine hydrolase [Anaerolineales bacterium]